MLGRKILLSTEALMKAFVAGGALGMAAFGTVGLGFIVAESDWLIKVGEGYALNAFGWGGGVAGIALQLFLFAKA